MRGLTRGERILRSWRKRRHCGNPQRSLGSNCQWGRSSCSLWRARSPEVCPRGWRSRHQGKTAWWMDRSLSQRWRDASCRSSWAACESLQIKRQITETQLCSNSVFSPQDHETNLGSVSADSCCVVDSGEWTMKIVSLDLQSLTWHLDKRGWSGWSSLWKRKEAWV